MLFDEGYNSAKNSANAQVEQNAKQQTNDSAELLSNSIARLTLTQTPQPDGLPHSDNNNDQPMPSSEKAEELTVTQQTKHLERNVDEPMSSDAKAENLTDAQQTKQLELTVADTNDQSMPPVEIATDTNRNTIIDETANSIFEKEKVKNGRALSNRNGNVHFSPYLVRQVNHSVASNRYNTERRTSNRRPGIEQNRRQEFGLTNYSGDARENRSLTKDSVSNSPLKHTVIEEDDYLNDGN